MSPPTTNDQQLWTAASKGDHTTVAALLKLGVSPNTTHDPGQATALHAAAQHGSLEVVRELLQQGAHPDAQTSEGSTALHLAAYEGHAEAAAALVAGGATVTARNSYGNTPLLHAAVRGDMATMQLLLKAGADIAAAANNQATALHGACQQGKHKAASLLLARGAAVDATTNQQYTPLHYAAENGHMGTAVVLLHAGASLTALSIHGRTPLFHAASVGKEDVVRLMLRSGADPYTPDTQGWLPLHHACQDGYLGVVNRLLYRRRVPAHVNAAGADAHTPLHLASAKGHAAVVQLLLRAGADVHAKTSNAVMPLHSAVVQGHGLVVEQLLAAGADPVALSGLGEGVLYFAALKGHTAILQQLLAAMAAGQGTGAVDTPFMGMTPLHWAVERMHTSCVEVLLAAGADPNKLYGAGTLAAGHSLAGVSVLYRAVVRRHAAALPLLATPANMAHVWKGRTPLQLALAYGRPGLEMAQALVAAGSPAGVANAAGATAMSYAARSKEAAHQALLPAMVRRECEAYKQRQQQPGVGGQQQQQEPTAVLAAVVDALYAHLTSTAVASRVEIPDQALACFQVVMEVLGPAVGGSLLQQVVGKVRGSSLAGASRESTFQRLVKALHTAWLEELQPLMQQRARVTNRTKKLVDCPVRKQPQQRKRPPFGKAPRSTTWTSKLKGLKGQASVAAAAGQWHLFVELLEQLLGLHKPSASSVLKQVQQQQQQVGEGPPDQLGLCEALLGAWRAAVVEVAGRMQRELVDAVVGAVQAALQKGLQSRQQQPQHAVVEGGATGVPKRRRTGRSQGRT